MLWSWRDHTRSVVEEVYKLHYSSRKPDTEKRKSEIVVFEFCKSLRKHVTSKSSHGVWDPDSLCIISPETFIAVIFSFSSLPLLISHLWKGVNQGYQLTSHYHRPELKSFPTRVDSTRLDTSIPKNSRFCSWTNAWINKHWNIFIFLYLPSSNPSNLLDKL